ncbi:hypothetical protein [Silvanigrella aquatica]|uniref:OmpA-like domain-containing protein n=1 Tax=Silvanigrella aquatica TaxID=1915309 RepID=A0A1L4D0F7_9BACT|nr:hypothetical protein [Silvanigrella aquatica]APJ03674.1 hypothetical protein AXG55_07045 [Silvanigrella aquatica]
MKSKIIITGSLCSLYFLIGNAFAYASEEINCEVEFKNNSSVDFVLKDSLEKCLLKIEGKNLETAIIIGSATASGQIKHNQKLAQERAVTIGRVIHSKFPDASIKEISSGVNKKMGRKIEINFLIKDESYKQKVMELSKELENLQAVNQKEKLKIEAFEEQQRIASINDKLAQNSINEKEENSFFNSKPNFRVALSSGINSTMKGPHHNYFAAGGEFAWINRNTLFRPEVGAKFMTSIDGVSIHDQDVSRVMNAYGFLGGGIALKGFVTGARLLLGNEWINIDSNTPKINEFAAGGEARLGYEWEKGLSLFASYGRTERIQMIGLDVGLSF